MQLFDGEHASSAYKGKDFVTLRDDFAGKAMVGILGNLAIADKFLAVKQREYWIEQYGNIPESDCVARESYVMADAMLKAREQ